MKPLIILTNHGLIVCSHIKSHGVRTLFYNVILISGKITELSASERHNIKVTYKYFAKVKHLYGDIIEIFDEKKEDFKFCDLNDDNEFVNNPDGSVPAIW